MGLSQPGGAGGKAPNVIYGECNTVPSGGSFEHAEFDLWYDKNQDDITAGIVAALAAIGLTYAAGTFTATEEGTWEVSVMFEAKECPAGQSNIVGLSTTMYPSNDSKSWDDATYPPGTSNFFQLKSTIYLNLGGGGNTFYLYQFIEGTLTDPECMEYATIAIVRLQ